IVESAARTYLESERFDRVGNTGKRHVVALDAIDRTFIDMRRENWIKSAEILRAKQLITAHELQDIARVFGFGQFIGNTDMHFGNLSFYVEDVVKPRIRLAPVYDMLPMMWRPGIHTGELDATPVREQLRAAGYDEAYEEARRWAVSFWQRAAALDALTDELREAASQSEARVSGEAK
ncbi:MAG: HipA domain-containing protein, partial [Burkholderiales bacterium]